MGHDEIDAIRALLGSKPRPVSWPERRQRLDEVGSVWPVADDVKLDPVDLDGVAGEWSIARKRYIQSSVVFPWRRLLSGSSVSHRRMVTEAGRARRADAGDRYRLAPENPFPAALEDALGRLALPAQ